MATFYRFTTGVIIYLLFAAGAYAQQCDVIYVTPTGAGSGSAGTRTNPASLTYAMSLVGGTATRLWLANGTYNINAELLLVNNVVIEGGFDPVTWAKSNIPATVVHRNNQIVLPPPANGTAIIGGVNVSGFRLQDLTLTMDIPNGVAATAYGIYLNSCSNYNIVRCHVIASDGTPGVAGAPGSPGASGNPGANGAAGNSTETGRFVPTPGGTGANNGGNGAGNGGHSGSSNVASTPGAGPCGGSAGANGTGPQCSLGCTFGSPSCGSATAGQPGGNAACGGTPGAPGAPGAPGTIGGLGYFIPGAAGGNGVAGGGGSGGGGGGGGGGRQNSGQDDVGGAGGGGGGGGFGGTGGTGGTGGGGSFAVFLFNNGSGGNIVDCQLTAGAGGAGGAGGTGGSGGTGGAGGAGGAAGCGPNPGGAGGAGSAGGVGGAGGNGVTGTSLALSETGGIPVTQSNITSVPGDPPVISIDNHGCTNSEVVFSSPSSGAWNFGSGASPATANGSGPFSVFYSSAGRKTITFSGTNFTEFVDVFNSQTVSGGITHTNNPSVVGCPDTFSTTLTGTLYEWDFGPTAIPSTVSSSTSTNAPVTFTSAGTDTVVLWVTTSCCGRVQQMLINTIQPNTLSITLAASSNSFCEGTSVTYTATPSGYQSYTFLVNNNPVQNSASNMFTTSALVPGDSVRVLGFDGICYTNPSSTLHPVITPIPGVTLASSDANDTICAGEPVTFTASPAGFTNYTFFDGATQLQSSSSETWSPSPILPPNTSISVLASNNGCISASSNAISTFVKPVPVITVTLPSAVCQGDVVTVTASPAGLTNYDFSVNGVSVQNSTADTYISSIFVTGDQVVVSGTLDGCPAVPSIPAIITVNPIPAVTLTSSDGDNSICQGETVTFTAAPTGYNTFEFFEGTTSVQSSALETYVTNTLTSSISITVVVTHLGCSSVPSNAIVTAVEPAPAVNAGNDISACIDAGLQTLSGFSPSGGIWTGNGIANFGGGFDPTIATAGAHSLVYTYTDPVSTCAGYDSIVFTVNALPVVVITPVIDICETQNAQLSAVGGIDYAWSPSSDLDNANVSNPQATPLSTTTYTVTVTDANNCVNTGTTTVNVNPNPVAGFSSDDVCEGLVTTFTNSSIPVNGNTYLWSFGDGNTSTAANPSYSYVASGNYNSGLVATLGICSDTAVSVVIVHPRAIAAFSASPSSSYTDNDLPIVFTNTSSYADSWLWEFGDGNNSSAQSPSHLYNNAGTYSVILIANNQFGCSDTSLQVDYINIYQTPIIFIPNTFTPNGDGNNDVLKVLTSDVRAFKWGIFNRLGEKVYESFNEFQGWDGTYKGQQVPIGVYTYTLKVTFADESARDMKGSVTVLR